jgi:KDO2-lipid IV(A) lauroyltransferase
VRRGKKIKRVLEVGTVETLIIVARLLPRRMGMKVFAAVGAAGARWFARDRQRAVENLGVAFPNAPAPIRTALARASFRALGKNAFEALRLARTRPEEIRDRVQGVEGMENFLDAYRKGRGVIVITGHIGCWELLPAYFANIGYTASVVARRLRVERLNERLVASRASVGVATLDRDANPRRMFELLRRGELLGVLIDQHTRVAGTYVPFFNRPAFTPTAVAKLALATGAAIVPMGIFMRPNGRHVVHVLPAIRLESEAGRANAVHELTAKCSLAVEELIRIDPTQWVWFHHRWRAPERPEQAGVAYGTGG